LARLFDLLFICERPMLAASLAASIALSACAPEDNRIAAAVQSGSDWMNNVEKAPAPNPWRLSDRPGLKSGDYPSLNNVPDRPTNLPDPQEVDAKIAALRQSGDHSGLGQKQRPDAASLGSPPAAHMAAISIPRSGSSRARAPAPAASRPAMPDLPAPAAANTQPQTPNASSPGPQQLATPTASPPPQAMVRDNTLDFNAESPNWFNAESRAAVTAFAQSEAQNNSLILLMMEGPEFSDDTVNPVRDQLVISGIPQDRISINFRIASLRRVRLRTLGQ
jgi:hypothetical protein